MTRSQLSHIMHRAWTISRTAAAQFGGRPAEYLAEALRMAWQESKGMTDYAARIEAYIPATKERVKGKLWTTEAYTAVFNRDADGHWSNEFGPMYEAEVISVCRKATNWVSIKSQYFVMDGFHN